MAPLETSKQRFVEQAFREAAHNFGFREIITPTFEMVELFKAKSGPAIVEEMFDFTDKSGRHLALRPEFTASIMRFYLSDLRNEPKPIKLSTIGNCFRYEEPQKGRFREFAQWNCEIIGAPSVQADAEIIAVAVAGLRKVGLKQIETRVGNIGMLRSFLKFPPEEQAVILHLLDKRRMDELKLKLEGLGSGNLHSFLSSVISLKGGPSVLDKAEKMFGETGKDSIDYLRSLGDQLSLYGIEDFVYDLGVVRGLDYYTGMVFEIDSPNLGAEKQVGGGGSYSLTEVLGGPAIFTTGFAMGIDRVVLSAVEEGVEMMPRPLDAFVVPIGEPMRRKGYEILQILREAGFSADIDLMGKGPSKNLEYANSIGARHVVIIGVKEESKGVVALRDMQTGDQVDVPIKDMVAAMKGLPVKKKVIKTRKKRRPPKKVKATRKKKRSRAKKA